MKYLISDSVVCDVILVAGETENDAYRAAAENEGWEQAVTDPNIRICHGAWFYESPNAHMDRASAFRDLRNAVGRDATEDDVSDVWKLVQYSSQGQFYYLTDLAAACSQVALKA